jgi:hypothetical protein
MNECIAILIEYIARSGEFLNLRNFRSTEHIPLILSLQRPYLRPHCSMVSQIHSSLPPSPHLCRLYYIHVQVTKSSTYVNPVTSVKNPHCRPRLHIISVSSSNLLSHPQSSSSIVAVHPHRCRHFHFHFHSHSYSHLLYSYHKPQH